MGRIIWKPTHVVEEVFQGKVTACNNCRKAIKHGDTTIACYSRVGMTRGGAFLSKKGTISARFCSRKCLEEKRDTLLDEWTES